MLMVSSGDYEALLVFVTICLDLGWKLHSTLVKVGIALDYAGILGIQAGISENHVWRTLQVEVTVSFTNIKLVPTLIFSS